MSEDQGLFEMVIRADEKANNARTSLARTGVLFTQHEDDLGHIPDYWRKTVVDLCDALDAAPTDVAEHLCQERLAHVATRNELAKALAQVESMCQHVSAAEAAKVKAEDDRRVAVHLVTDAVPRMKTLNSAMSVGWLERAQKLLED